MRLEGSAALDALFRHQLTDLLATRLLAAHAGSPTTFQPTMGGLSPNGTAPRHRTSALGQRCGRLPRGAGFGCRPVALPLLPRLQGKHRAFAACLAAPAPARAGHEHAARHRRIGRLGRSRAWLLLADRLRRGVQKADRRNPERLAEAQALAAIARQVRQSLWGSGRPDQLDHHHVQTTTTETKDDLEELRQPTGNHVTTQRPRDRSRVRTFVGCSLHFGSGRGGGNSAAVRARDRIR